MPDESDTRALVAYAQSLEQENARLRKLFEEPTQEMWEAWRSVNCKIGERGMEEFTSFYGDHGNWLACHQAMGRAALNGE